MSDVVSLDLSRELYELSGWDGTGQWYVSYSGEGWELKPYLDQEALDEAPAYSLGYLIRRLQPITLERSIEGVWMAYQRFDEREAADTPEDCVAKLCIKLIKQGVIQP